MSTNSIVIWRNLPAICCLIPFIMVLSTIFIIDSGFSDATVTGKYFWFYIAMGLCSIATITLFLLRKKFIKFILIDWGILIFCILGIINQLYTGSGYLPTKFVLLLLCCILYFYFRIVIQQYNWTDSILSLFFLITALVEIIWGLLQLYGCLPSWNYLFKITGSFFNPGPFGGYAAMVVPLAFYYILSDWWILNGKYKWEDWFRHIRLWLSLLVCLGAILIIPAAMSRASWLALLGGCWLVAILFFRLRIKKYILKVWKEKRRKILISSLFIVIFIFLGFLGIYSLKKDSADGRKLIWKISLNTLWNHKPGVGLGNFPGYYCESQAAYFRSGQGSEQDEWVAGCPNYAFNEYLQIGVELGLLTLCVFLFLFFAVLYIGIRHRNIAPVGGLFSLFIFASMSYPFNVLPFVISLVFLMALSITARVKEDKKYTGSIPVFLIGLFMVVSFLLYNRYPTRQAYKDWMIAERYSRNEMKERAIAIYEKNIPHLKDQVAFLYEYSDILSVLGRKVEALLILEDCTRLSCDPAIYNRMGKEYQDMGMYQEAEMCYQMAANIVPNRIYPYYLLAKLYMVTGDVDKSKEMAGVVVNKIPKVDSQTVREMKKEMEMHIKTKRK